VALNSSCGLCGRRNLESLEMDAPPLPVEWQVEADLLASLPTRLRRAQPTFDATGGLHASGLFRLDGGLDASAEDVGRHNAVDKLVGRMLRAGRLPLRQRMLCVSGRSSFEIVQKAFRAGIPLIASVSAPSSLSVELAERTGLTLLGFVRDGGFNVYGHWTRIAHRGAVS
jgi:FdhD protein